MLFERFGVLAGFHGVSALFNDSTRLIAVLPEQVRFRKRYRFDESIKRYVNLQQKKVVNRCMRELTGGARRTYR